MIRRLIILLLIVGCEEPSQHGCLDGQATNYDATASIDNNTCTYIDSCGVVDIDLTNDCVKDECGVWGDDNSTCSGCIDIYALNYDNSAIINADCNYADHTIDITDNGISPFILEILTGESVQWNNKTSQQVGINGDIAEINYDLNSDGFIDIFIGEPLNAGDHTFYLSERGQGVIGSLLFDSAWWYSYDCIQESCVIDNAETIVEDCIEYQNTSLVCMPLIVVMLQ